jgi:DNA-binding response OmpR family regulator
MVNTILVIEDEERILQFLRRGLSYEGYRVETAVNGTDGLHIAQAQSPDLVS